MVCWNGAITSPTPSSWLTTQSTLVHHSSYHCQPVTVWLSHHCGLTLRTRSVWWRDVRCCLLGFTQSTAATSQCPYWSLPPPDQANAGPAVRWRHSPSLQRHLTVEFTFLPRSNRCQNYIKSDGYYNLFSVLFQLNVNWWSEAITVYILPVTGQGRVSAESQNVTINWILRSSISYERPMQGWSCVFSCWFWNQKYIFG